MQCYTEPCFTALCWNRWILTSVTCAWMIEIYARRLVEQNHVLPTRTRSGKRLLLLKRVTDRLLKLMITSQQRSLPPMCYTTGHPPKYWTNVGKEKS